MNKYNNDIDNEVDVEVYKCFNPNDPKSFFLFAGAGSGKTRTLVNVLTEFKEEYGRDYKLKNKKIAIITYTNAAADEINHRLEFSAIFSVSTIHSFCWNLIQTFTSDIKAWLRLDLKKSIEELEILLSKSRNLANKTSVSNAKKVKTKTKRLENLDMISKFSYNPNSDNLTKDSLNHSEVISIAASFIATKKLFKKILVNRHPIILIDESQDTKKDLIEALFSLQKESNENFSLGLFGDTMQRIYNDGKERLGENLPDDWVKPVKQMNHRSKSRIIELINKIREGVDQQQQIARTEKTGGFVKFFIVQRGLNKLTTEEEIKRKMSIITKDDQWICKDIPKDKNCIPVKTLTLEHHMAAVRMGFATFFNPLYSVDKIRTGLLDGSSSPVNFFTKIIIPLIAAYKVHNNFEIANIIKIHSPILSKENIKKEKDQFNLLKIAKAKVEKLFFLWEDNKSPTLLQILNVIHESKLFNIPLDLRLSIDRSLVIETETDGEDVDDDKALMAWDDALKADFNEIVMYNNYITENSGFGTHQGVKGLEYERVMVVIDDEEARGFQFSYDKLFGISPLTASDTKNIEEGKETHIDRTSRLFYVACSRAKESLAIVAYSTEAPQLRDNLIKFKWFTENEIEIIQ
ncbi:UvrD-helicase domain-containing protein [Chryseobacterium sp. 18068]|uniref:UvrD-helicase domain-containing protein n=1 Tax=Chryseobacterium sp. 18068 TaxID=2681414 RepID=UPI001E3CF690|nr:UvrD-helicase domain-containing protein [Chryseobacterium sp. 18068]